MSKSTSNALDIIREETGVDPRSDPQVQAYRRPFEIAQLIYDARTNAGLSQQQLANLIRTDPSVVAELENADYGGDLVGMLERVAEALQLKLQFRLVPREKELQADLEHVR